MSGEVVDFYDNATGYVPPCCRPGGRCTQATPEVELSEEDQHALSEFINTGASIRDVLKFWNTLKSQAVTE